MEPFNTASNGAAAGSHIALPETVEVSTGADPVFSVIWLHGLGADGHDFEPVVPMLGLQGAPAVRFVFPHAPVRPVTLNGGMAMRAWYDIKSISASRDQDEAGIRHSAALVDALVAREQQRGVPVNQQVLAGFSQGGAMALYAGLRYPQRLAGVISLSAYLLFAERLASEKSAANAGLPVFIGHGSMDPVVPFAMGKASADALKKLGYAVDWHSYPIPHSVAAEELGAIGRWLRARMN
jgi:phospholipase/carboxylesterase